MKKKIAGYTNCAEAFCTIALWRKMAEIFCQISVG